MKHKWGIKIFAVVILSLIAIPLSHAQQIYPAGAAPIGYRYTGYNDPGDNDVFCYDTESCVCWHKMDVKFTNDGPDAYDVSATMTCRPCSMDDTWPDRIYTVQMGNIPSGGSVWSQSYFALKADACIPDCPVFSDNPCWRVQFRNSPGGTIHVIYNVPWAPDWRCECGKVTTLITLASFTAEAGNRSVALAWETETEIENAGFNILRSESENGEYIQLNDGLIPAKGSPTQGAVYEFFNGGVKNRKIYYYVLEDIDINGTATTHGPVSTTPRLIYGIKK